MSTSNSSKRVYLEYDYIRVIGTLLVVLGHSVYTNMETKYGGISIVAEYAIIHKLLLLVVRLIYSFHMPLFFFLSGTLFALGNRKGKWNNLLDVIRIKSKKLLLPLITIGIFYAIPIKIISGYYSESKNVLFDALIGQMVYFDNNYLWFLPSLFFCFVLSWVLSHFIKEWQTKVLIAVCFLVLGINIPCNYFGIQRCLINYIWFETGRISFDYKDKIDAYFSKSVTKVIIVLLTVIVYGIYLTLLKDNPYFYRVLSFFGIICVYIFSLNLKGIHYENFFGFNTIHRNSLAIYLFSDPWNYIILSFLKNHSMLYYYKFNWFCILIVVFRFSITITVSLIVNKLFIWIEDKFKNETNVN